MCLQLADLCLNTIVDNFHQYYSLFSLIENVDKKRNFEFLQRKYSSVLLARLYEKGDLQEKFINLLINKYLRVLDTSWFDLCCWDKTASKIAEIGCNIEEIIFRDVLSAGTEQITAWQDVVRYLPELRKLSIICSVATDKFQKYHSVPTLRCSDIHDLILKNVAKFCANIEEIDFGKATVKRETAKYLCQKKKGKLLCTKLKKLSLLKYSFKDNDVKYLLKHLPSLEIIDYYHLPRALYSLHKKDLSSLDKVKHYNITLLNMTMYDEEPHFADMLKVCLSVCPHLKSLSCNVRKQNELIFISNLSHLEKLRISNVSDSEININNLLKCIGRKLISLAVANFTVSFSVFSECCPRIQELGLFGEQFLVDDDSKAVFNSLTYCAFFNRNGSLSERTVSALLSSAPRLDTISFNQYEFLSYEIKTSILKCCRLCPIKEISFCNTKIEKEYIKDLLLNCDTLNSLTLYYCFDPKVECELLEFTKRLPNKVKLFTIDRSDINDDKVYSVVDEVMEVDDDHVD